MPCIADLTADLAIEFAELPRQHRKETMIVSNYSAAFSMRPELEISL